MVLHSSMPVVSLYVCLLLLGRYCTLLLLFFHYYYFIEKVENRKFTAGIPVPAVSPKSAGIPARTGNAGIPVHPYLRDTKIVSLDLIESYPSNRIPRYDSIWGIRLRDTIWGIRYDSRDTIRFWGIRFWGIRKSYPPDPLRDMIHRIPRIFLC